MHFYQTERIALFIDGANLYATAKALGFDIDYKRLLALFRTKGQLVRALYYTALAEDQEYSSIRPLVDWLDYNGYTMVTKPTKEFTDSLRAPQDQGQHGHRADRRCHAAGRSPGSRGAVHGRWRFSRIGWRRCSRAARRVSVVSTLQTQPPMVADELRRQADQFIDLADLEDQVCRDPASRPAREPREPGPAPRTRPGDRRRPPRRWTIPTTRKTAALTPRPLTTGGRGHDEGRRSAADCPLCPRLVAFRNRNQTAEPGWYNGAVPSFGRRERTPADRRPGTRPRGRQSHGSPVHRRLCRRPSLRNLARLRLRARQLRGAARRRVGARQLP